jgi:hypothetical protein
MQTIYRTIHASNFTILSNAIANNESLSGNATAALIYLISKPKYWEFNARDVKRRLNIGMNKVYKVMQELIRAGYATCKRIQSGAIWNIYDTPQNIETATDPVESHRVNFEHVGNECVLERNDSLERNTTTPTASATPTQTQNIVVVSSELKEELIYPPQIKDLKPIKAVLKKIKPEVVAKQPAIKQEVLFELAYRMTLQNLRSVPAFLNTLVTAVNDGTFTLTATKQDTGSTIGIKAHIETQHLLNKQRQLKSSPQDVGRAAMTGLKMAIRGVVA